MREAAEIRWDEVFLEVFARVSGDNLIAQVRRELVEPLSDHIETDARVEQSNFRTHILSNARRRVQCYRFPDSLHVLFGYVMRSKELACGIGAIDLEALVLAGEFWQQTEIMDLLWLLQQVAPG